MTIKNKANKTRAKTNAKLIILIILTIFLIKTTTAIPQIQLISQTNPLEYMQIQTIILNITSNTSVTQAQIGFDQQNHTLEKEGTHYTYAWVPANKGINTYKIYAKDAQDQEGTYTNSFEVQDTTPPEITETQPQGNLDYNLIELKAITNENSTCRYDEQNLSYDSMNYELSGQGTIHTKLRSLGDREHQYYTRCKDPENNIGRSQIIIFTIDTTPPKITSIEPTGTVNQKQQTINLKTKETATCKWGKTNKAYDSLDNQFQTTGGTQHQQPITLEEGINTYYLSCKDQIGNKNPTITLNIELNLPPTASINIENNTYKALKRGTYDLTLTTSEALSQAPTLKLQYNTKLINIPLEGSSQTWTGYLIIPENAGEYTGEFKYTGKDTKGTIGIEVTSGKLVIIDTKTPATPKNLRLLNKNNKIEISWDYEGEETNHYKIYRSTTGKTDKADYYTTTKETTNTDANVKNKIGYFYRISAVDQAGNQGTLSEEKFLMTNYKNTTPEFVQDEELLILINNKINELENLVQNIQTQTKKMDETTNKDLLRIINEQNLMEKQEETTNKILVLIGELKTYKETRITKTELNNKNRIIDTKLEQYKKEIIKEVRLTSKTQNEQVPKDNLIQKTIAKYLEKNTLLPEQKEIYYQKTTELQGKARVVQEIIKYEIEYEHKESQNIILIIETILLQEEQKGILIQEIIPKDAVKISSLNFTDTPQEINSLGIVWSLEKLQNSEVLYKTGVDKDMSQLQSINTILLYDIENFLNSLMEGEDEPGSITGDVINEEKKSFSLTRNILIPLGILILLALIIYYFVFLKTENSYEKEIINQIDEKEHKSLDKINILDSSKFAYDHNVNSKVTKLDYHLLLNSIQLAYGCLEKDNLKGAYENYYFALGLYPLLNMNFKNKLKVNFKMNTLRDEIKNYLKSKDLYI